VTGNEVAFSHVKRETGIKIEDLGNEISTGPKIIISYFFLPECDKVIGQHLL